MNQTKKIFEELWRSRCLKDARYKHFWEKLGIARIGETYLVWKCSQCQKCLYEELEFLRKNQDE